MTEAALCSLSATEVAEGIRSRALSPVEATRAALERIERLNSRYHAYLTVCWDEALAAAQEAEQAVLRGDDLGPLRGVPVSVKDLLYVQGVRSTGGSLVFSDHVPEHDAPTVRRLREAGAIILGKTNTPEFGIAATTENRLGPPCGNPWDPERTPGGSSGGAAAAAAAELGFVHLGTDGGGSIRIPASFCGVFGLKPTTGRVPAYTSEWGGFGAWPTLSQAGPIARTVEDAALLLDVIAGPEPTDPFALPRSSTSFRPEAKDRLGLRVAWSPDLGFAAVDPEVRALCKATALRFRDLGCEVEQAAPEVDDGLITSAFLPLAAASDAAAYGHLLDGRANDLCDYTREFLGLGLQVTAQQYITAERQRMELWRRFDDFLSRYDLLVTPTLATAAFPIGQPPKVIDGRAVRPYAWTPFTMVCNLTGQPAASVPCGWTRDGLPIGLHVIARAFRERTILEAALAYQRAYPWQDRRPPEPGE